MVLNIIGFIVLVTLVMAVTCIVVFQSHFSRLERQVEEEYQRLCPILEKRRQILSSFFSIEAVKSWGIEGAFNQSVLHALAELSANNKNRNLVFAKHNLLSNLLFQRQMESKKEKNIKEGEQGCVWKELDGYTQVLAMEDDYVNAIKSLQLAIRTYNVLRQVFPASLVAKLLKKEAIENLY